MPTYCRLRRPEIANRENSKMFIKLGDRLRDPLSGFRESNSAAA
jgi:hypothetical protein